MNESIPIMYGFILARIVLLYLSTSITANIMSQIYTERVLINGEEPPVLRNTIFLFIIIDGILNLLLLGLLVYMINSRKTQVHFETFYCSIFFINRYYSCFIINYI